MADNELPTGTTDDATGTTAPAVGGSADAPADGSASAEGIEELRKQLQDEKRKNEQLLSEKTNVEQLREELRRQRESTASPPPTASADPYEQQIVIQQQILARYGENSYEGQTAIANLHALGAAQRNDYATRFMVQMRRDLLKVPVEQRDEVESRMLNGEFNTVAQALEAVKGSRSGQTIEALQRELAELKAKVNGTAPPPRVANVSTSIRTQVDAATHKKVMGLDEYTRLVERGGQQALNVMAQVDSGEIKLDYTG